MGVAGAEISELAAAPRPRSLFANIRVFLPTLSLPKLKLPSLKLSGVKLPRFGLKLPTLKLPALTIPASSGSQPGTPRLAVKKEPEGLHYARTPLATYARVKSRLQDRPPLVAAFADQVSVLSPSSLAPPQTFESSGVGKTSSARNLRTSVLLKNLRDLLPTPVAALFTSDSPRRRSLVSILGGRAAKKVVADIEVLSNSLLGSFTNLHHVHIFRGISCVHVLIKFFTNPPG